jgi:hypothetical protein
MKIPAIKFYLLINHAQISLSENKPLFKRIVGIEIEVHLQLVFKPLQFSVFYNSIGYPVPEIYINQYW